MFALTPIKAFTFLCFKICIFFVLNNRILFSADAKSKDCQRNHVCFNCWILILSIISDPKGCVSCRERKSSSTCVIPRDGCPSVIPLTSQALLAISSHSVYNALLIPAGRRNLSYMLSLCDRPQHHQKFTSRCSSHLGHLVSAVFLYVLNRRPFPKI